MQTLQRYILGELLRVLLVTITSLTLLLVVVGVFQRATEMGLGAMRAMQMLPFIVPSILPYTIPATLLLTICVVYGRLSADYEITAAKAAGINVMSLLTPAFLLGAVLSVFSLVLCDQVIPWAEASMQRIALQAREDILFDILAAQNSYEDRRNGWAISVAGVDHERRLLLRPNIRYATPKGGSVIAQAASATLRFDPNGGRVLMGVNDGWIEAPGEMQLRLHEQEIPLVAQFGSGDGTKERHLNITELKSKVDSARVSIETSKDAQAIETAFVLAVGGFEQLAQPSIQKHATQTVAEIGKINRSRTEIHGRFAMSCGCFFFALVGCPFSILQARRQFLTTFFLCFMPTIVIYYLPVLLMQNLGRVGKVEPSWGMWLGNLVLFIAALFTLRKAIQH